MDLGHILAKIERMHGKIEGRPSVHVWSLRNEGLLELKPGESADISVWITVSFMDHREWERYEDRCDAGEELQMTAELQNPVTFYQDAPPEAERKTYALRWGRKGVVFSSETVDAVSSPRTVGKNAGLRWWWSCPHCSRPVNALYLKQASYFFWRFLCRTCHDLCYSSENLTRSERAINRVFAGSAPIESSNFLRKLLHLSR